MQTLILLRHAKSSWKSPTQPDEDRALSARGEADAPLMGKAMAKHGIEPDLVLCSAARRTRDTLALVLPELKREPRVAFEQALYHASAAEMLRIMRGIGNEVKSLMLVGHNPEIHQLALDLIGAGPSHLRDRLAPKLPTAGLVAINFQGGGWTDVTVNSGTLALFLTPRELTS